MTNATTPGMVYLFHFVIFTHTVNGFSYAGLLIRTTT
jgi:hypothetical protein